MWAFLTYLVPELTSIRIYLRNKGFNKIGHTNIKLGCTSFLEEFEQFKGFVKVMPNIEIKISTTIAHWYVIQCSPVRSWVMSLKFQKLFASY